jgi:hypothetical protein
MIQITLGADAFDRVVSRIRRGLSGIENACQFLSFDLTADYANAQTCCEDAGYFERSENSIERPGTFNMRMRKLIGLLLDALGLALAAVSLNVAAIHSVHPVSIVLLIVLAVLLMAVGLIVLIRDLFEGWLDRGQSALVDGLSAG